MPVFHVERSPRPARAVELPELVARPGVRVRTVLEGDTVAHVAEIKGGASAAATARAFHRARAQLADVPEVIGRVDLQLDQRALDAIAAAEARRRARAARRSR